MSVYVYMNKNIDISPYTCVCGHFGSGKTNVSVALALYCRSLGMNTTLLDLDIVNPYFRAADNVSLLNGAGIRTIVPRFANTNVDIPTLDADINCVFDAAGDNPAAIFDVGGDNGSAALGRFHSSLENGGCSLYYVANMYRPLTQTPELTLESIREVEYYSRLKCTHIVNNSNLGALTTEETITDSFGYADRLSALTGLPIIFTSVVGKYVPDDFAVRYKTQNIFIIEDTTRKIFY